MHFTPDWGMFWIAVLTFVFTGFGAFIGKITESEFYAQITQTKEEASVEENF